MADPFVAEIRIFPFNFVPRGWAWCDGQLMPLSQNTALFSLLGTTYGGNGRNNFGLPNLQGRAPMHPGQGPGLSLYELGESGGTESVTLSELQIPSHNHALRSANAPASTSIPNKDTSIARSTGGTAFKSRGESTQVPLANQAIGFTGGSHPHNNLQPYLTVYFAIALQGIYPPRS